MDLIRRLLSAGGWLANMVNQRNSRYGNLSNDEAVRPLAPLLYLCGKFRRLRGCSAPPGVAFGRA
jgi:hypothetical protein